MPLRLPKVRSDLEFFDQEVEGESVVVIRDPVRGTYYKYNPLQAAMLRSLDGVRTLDEMVAELSVQFEVEIPRAAADRFVAHARKQLLLDISCSGVPEREAHKKVMKALAKQGFRFRDLATTGDVGKRRIASQEAVMFMGGIRQLQAGQPAKALDYFSAVIELDPNNERAKQLATTIQNAYVKAMSGATVDFPSWKLFNPTRSLAWLDRMCGRFLFSWLALIPILALVGIAVYSYVITPYPALHVTVFDVIAAIAITNVHLMIHEYGHGLACYHYGGAVPEIGVQLFYYVRPVPYCDTSSTYLFTDRKHKMIVQLAGTIVSIAFTAMIFIFLGLVHSEIWVYPAVQLLMWFSVIQLGLNLVPFLKGDGYYAVCDYLGIPNLRERSIKYLHVAIGSRLLGLDGTQEDLTPGKRRLFIGFAVASVVFTAVWVYQAVFMLLAPIVEHYQFMGLVVASIVLWYLLRGAVFRPIGSFVKLLVRERRTIFTLRRSIVLALVAGALIGPWLIPWPVLVDGDFEIMPHERVQVRAQTTGVIDQVLVKEGDVVTKGQPLAVLRNPEVDLEVAVLDAELAKLDARLAQLHAGARPEELQLASRQLGMAQATRSKHAERAAITTKLATAGVGTQDDAASASEAAAVSAHMVHAASWKLAELEAGARPEDIAATEAERTRVAAQRDHAIGERELLTLRSPIAGVVVTPRLSDRRYEKIERGGAFAEIQDTGAYFAEIRLPASSPLDELAPGDEIELRPIGAPAHPIAARIDHVRPSADPGKHGDLIVVTTAFTNDVARGGMHGHARLYGKRRSLAYSQLYLPLQRLVRVTLWSMM